MKNTTSENTLLQEEEERNLNSSKEGILKRETGDETIPNLSKNTTLLTRKKVKGTPFEIIGQENVGYWVSMGIFRLSEPTETLEEAEELVKTPTWDMIINVICGIIGGKEMEEARKANTGWDNNQKGEQK